VSDTRSTSTAEPGDSDTDPRAIARTAAVVGGLVAVALVATVLASLATVALVGREANPTITFVATTLGTELSFLLVGVAFLGIRSSFDVPTGLPDRRAYPSLVGGLLASLLTALLSLAATDAILPGFDVLPGYLEYGGFGSLSETGLVIGAVLSLLVIAPVEEFFFRGILQRRLREVLGPLSAIWIAGAAFALFHVYPVVLLSPPVGPIAHMAAYYTVMGAIFGLVYHRTDTLVAPVFVHGGFNAVLFVLLVFV
jgi:membrane protease YdiL (CAAX protease family)